MKKSSNKKWFLNFKWILWWKQDQDELKKQVENYNSLKIIKSYRGISTLLIIFSAFLTLGLSLTGWIDIPLDEAILTVIIYLTLTYFIWWIIFMRYLFGAYQVEKLRKQTLGSS